MTTIKHGITFLTHIQKMFYDYEIHEKEKVSLDISEIYLPPELHLDDAGIIFNIRRILKEFTELFRERLVEFYIRSERPAGDNPNFMGRHAGRMTCPLLFRVYYDTLFEFNKLLQSILHSSELEGYERTIHYTQFIVDIVVNYYFHIYFEHSNRRMTNNEMEDEMNYILSILTTIKAVYEEGFNFYDNKAIPKGNPIQMFRKLMDLEREIEVSIYKSDNAVLRNGCIYKIWRDKGNVCNLVTYDSINEQFVLEVDKYHTHLIPLGDVSDIQRIPLKSPHHIKMIQYKR